jgi:hypothetical protein
MENVIFHRVAGIDVHTATFVGSVVLAQPYHDPKIDYQAIQAQKRAPRYIRQLKQLMGCWPNPALSMSPARK